MKAVKAVNHIGFMRKSRRGRALKLDINLEAFLLAERYVTKDGKEWVNMVVSVEKVLDVLEGKVEAAGISQLERGVAKMGIEEGENIESHA